MPSQKRSLEEDDAAIARETRRRKALKSNVDPDTQAARKASLDRLELPEMAIKTEPGLSTTVALRESLSSPATPSRKTNETGERRTSQRNIANLGPAQPSTAARRERDTFIISTDSEDEPSPADALLNFKRRPSQLRRPTRHDTAVALHDGPGGRFQTRSTSEDIEQDTEPPDTCFDDNRSTYVAIMTRLRADHPIVATTADFLLRRKLARALPSPLFASGVEDLIRELRRDGAADDKIIGLRPVLRAAEVECTVAWLRDVFRHDIDVLEGACRVLLPGRRRSSKPKEKESE